MNIDDLKNILIQNKLISEIEWHEVEREAIHKGRTVEDILIEKGVVSSEVLGQAVAEYFGVPFVNLRTEIFSEDVLKIIPELVAKNQQIIAFNRTADGIKLAMADPKNLEMIHWLEKKTGEKIIPYYATSSDIREVLKFYRKEFQKTFEEIIKIDTKSKTGDIPIIKIVDTIIKYAYENRASDIHVEPRENETELRFRIDGILHPVAILPKKIHNLIITRVKVMSGLRTDEHFAAQDGKFQAKCENERFDVRVSIIPISDGEKVVMRLLSERARRFNLESLGLGARDLKIVEINIQKPWGMILATGPTGCGKTTTLYAILKILNKPGVNIMTIEDPIEYDIEGVNQIQVNPKTGLTFANGLRSIVRQDPDIIMVGEIRDRETASIAVNSAMTGHLVLSTLHTNNAATTLPRLIDMGVEPFLVASSVNVIIAQRLVRKICQKCRGTYTVEADILQNKLPEALLKKLMRGRTKAEIYRGRGCKLCANTGYLGRIGIFEVLKLDEDIKKLIIQRADADQIQAQATKNGMTTMLEDGINKVLAGITTIDEVLRVTKE